jgi:hypothetical protein
MCSPGSRLAGIVYDDRWTRFKKGISVEGTIMRILVGIVAMFPLVGLGGNTYSTKAELPEPSTSVAPGRRAPDSQAANCLLAPVARPKRDFWVGTITIERKKEINHRREGKANINHAFMKGDGHFNQHDEYHESSTVTITIEPCPDPSVCWARPSGKVEYSLSSTQFVRRTQPRVCRGGANSVISDSESRTRNSSAKGPVKTFASVYWRDDGWHVEASAFGKDVNCQTVIVESSTSDQGCGAKPVSDNPDPTTESCSAGDPQVSFSTGNTDPAARLLDGTKSLEHTARPDPPTTPSGTVNEDRTVIYHLRRIQDQGAPDQTDTW